MANPIDLIITKEALAQLDSLIAKTRVAQNEALKLSQDFLNANKNISSANTPSALKSNSASNASSTASVQQQTAIIVDSQKKIAKAFEDTRLAQIKLQQQNANTTQSTVRNTGATRENSVANQILRAETDRNFRANTMLAGAYSRASARLLILKKEAKDAAIAFGEESIQAQRAAKSASELDARIKSADATVGDFQRNVGNYSNGVTKGLAGIFSGIRQLAYILPGLGVAGIIGFATEPIINYISSLKLFSKELGSVQQAQKLINESSKEGAKNAVEETLALQGNLAISKDVTLRYKERMIAVENLQKQYPFYFENLTKEQILAGDTAKAEEALTLAILSRAKANASVTKITENQSKIIDLEEKRIEVVNRLRQAEERLRATQSRTNAASASETAYQTEVNSIRAVATQKENLADIDKEINDLNIINNRLSAYALENQKTAIGLDYTKTKATADNTRKRIEGIELEARAYNSLIENIEKQIALIQTLQKNMSTSNEQWQEYERTINDLNRLIDNIKNGQKELRENAEKGVESAEKQNKAWLDGVERLNALKKATEDYISTLSNSFLKDAGLGSLQQFFDGTFDKLMMGADTLQEKFAVTFLAISEVAQEAFNFINQASQKNFDAEYRRLEMQKEVAIQFAGDSTTAQERINTEYDRRKREIQRREAEAQKKIAVFNILINTAQGVVSALTSTPPNVPLSIAIGLIGALQAGIVQSQPIPQFFEGGTHKGGIMMVNDAKGNSYKETVVTPDGKVIKPQGRNVLMNAPAETEIFTPEQWKAKENALGNILAERGISFNPSIMRNFAFGGSTGISKSDFDNGISTLSKNIKNATRPMLSVDKKGIRLYEINGQKRTERLNRRFDIR